MDYEKARALMKLHASRVRGYNKPDVKKLAHRTHLKRGDDGCYRIWYCATCILEFWPTDFWITDGGFFSSSTMQRLNQFMPNGFHVRGCTYQELKLKRPLGFVRTPDGIYPYNLPAKFTYSGQQLVNALIDEQHDDEKEEEEETTSLTNNATVVKEVTAYVDNYLKQLCSGAFVDSDEVDVANFWRPQKSNYLIDRGRQSRNVEFALRTGTTFADLAYVACLEQGNPEFGVTGMNLGQIATLLENAGAKAFRKPRTRVDAARRLEDTLFYGGPIPNLTIPELKKLFRQHIIEFLVRAIGFSYVEWNRR